MKYKHYKYDESIMQSRTVGNIIEALVQSINNGRTLRIAATFLIETRQKALKLGDGRKANSGKKKEEIC